MAEMPADLWVVPDAGGLRYQYVPGLAVAGPVALLAYEPDLGDGRRLILRTSGDIGPLSSAEIQAAHAGEAKP
jgi:hypothetical protein